MRATESSNAVSTIVRRAWLGPVLATMLLSHTAVGESSMPAAGELLSPQSVVEQAANALQDGLAGKRAYYADHRDELYELIETALLPHFDTRYAGYLVLGKHWKPASKEQRDRFISTFSDFIVRTYAKSMLELDQTKLEFYPDEVPADSKKTVVRTQLELEAGDPVPVNYSMRRTSKGWKIYDVRVEGVSYVQNYRSQFNAEISARGLDAVIARLEQETRELGAGEG